MGLFANPHRLPASALNAAVAREAGWRLDTVRAWRKRFAAERLA